MREPKTQLEKDVARAIKAKGEAVLESGEAWRDGILTFTTYGNPTQQECEFMDGLLTYWQQRIEHNRHTAENPTRHL